MTVFALTLAILALAMPLGASAADERDDPQREAPRRQETPTVEIIDTSVAPVVTGPTHFVAVDPQPPGCPEGFEPVQPPLNPSLGCLPTNAAAGSVGSEQIDPDPTCPEGWVPAVPPLNPALGCVAATEAIEAEFEPQTATFAGADAQRHPGHDDCPPGWVPARSPLNEDLGCLNNTLSAAIVAGDASGGPRLGTDGGARHPGHGCPEGYVQKLLLKQNPDGSLTFSYGCVKDGGGIVSGPDDITAGAVEPVVAYVAWTGPAILTVEACPEGSARHPDYLEYGCIPYGAGPWAL